MSSGIRALEETNDVTLKEIGSVGDIPGVDDCVEIGHKILDSMTRRAEKYKSKTSKIAASLGKGKKNQSDTEDYGDR